MIVDLKELVEFYDHDQAAGHHSNAVKTLAGEELGFALMGDYFVRDKAAIAAARLSGACTPGQTKGERLDGWFEVKYQDAAEYYQVEVKSWSFHGYGSGGGPLPVDCEEDVFSAFQTTSWNRYWRNGRFKSPKLNKVLSPMKPPKRHPQIATHRPMACLWSPVHPMGAMEPLFTVNTRDCPSFEQVTVFSMSTYARSLIQRGERSIDLRLPKTEGRLRHLTKIFAAS